MQPAASTRRRGGAGCLPGVLALLVVGAGIVVVAVAWFTSSARDWGPDANRSFSTPGSATYQLSAGTFTLWRTGSIHVAPGDVTVKNLQTGQRPVVKGTSGILGFATGIANTADMVGQVTLPSSGRWRFTVGRSLGEEVALGPSTSSITWIVIGALIIAVALLATIVLGIVWLATRV